MLRAEWPRATVHASSAIDAALAGFLARHRRALLAMLADGPTDDAAREGQRTEIARIDAGPALRPDRMVDGRRTLPGAGDATFAPQLADDDVAQRLRGAARTVDRPPAR